MFVLFPPLPTWERVINVFIKTLDPMPAYMMRDRAKHLAKNTDFLPIALH
jgi:hypothetical protein